MEDIISSFSQVLGSPSSLIHSTNCTEPLTNNHHESTINTLSQNLLHLFTQSEFSDVTFILSNGERILAHKGILICRCPYFRSLLCCGMRETFASEIPIYEILPEIFVVVLKFIYSDQLFLDSSETPADKVFQIFDAARYYGLDRLMRYCENSLIEQYLCEETATDLWNSAVSINCPFVASACRQFYEERFENIIHLESFPYLDKTLFLILLESERLIVSSQQVLTQAIVAWGKVHTGSESENYLSKRDFIGIFFPLLRKPRIWKYPQNRNHFIQNLVSNF